MFRPRIFYNFHTPERLFAVDLIRHIYSQHNITYLATGNFTCFGPYGDTPFQVHVREAIDFLRSQLDEPIRRMHDLFLSEANGPQFENFLRNFAQRFSHDRFDHMEFLEFSAIVGSLAILMFQSGLINSGNYVVEAIVDAVSLMKRHRLIPDWDGLQDFARRFKEYWPEYEAYNRALGVVGGPPDSAPSGSEQIHEVLEKLDVSEKRDGSIDPNRLVSPNKRDSVAKFDIAGWGYIVTNEPSGCPVQHGVLKESKKRAVLKSPKKKASVPKKEGGSILLVGSKDPNVDSPIKVDAAKDKNKLDSPINGEGSKDLKKMDSPEKQDEPTNDQKPRDPNIDSPMKVDTAKDKNHLDSPINDDGSKDPKQLDSPENQDEPTNDKKPRDSNVDSPIKVDAAKDKNHLESPINDDGSKDPKKLDIPENQDEPTNDQKPKDPTDQQ